ncbi:MAG: flagellar transcriptional regulator FlhD [Limnobacter sp.]|nr:flagellar transcriptional regulator FlhD [Limnobacter sp.]
MNTKLLSDLQEVNLSFLVLAQRMWQDNPVSAKAQLGLPDAVCERLAQLSSKEMVRLSNLPLALCSLRLSSDELWQILTDAETDPRVAALHGSILGYGSDRAERQAG